MCTVELTWLRKLILTFGLFLPVEADDTTAPAFVITRVPFKLCFGRGLASGECHRTDVALEEKQRYS